MHIFKAFVTAGPKHPTYPEGMEMRASVFVDARHEQEAVEKATTRLLELGWHSLRISETVLLPPNPELSALRPQLRQALALAEDVGVAPIAYPPRVI